MPAEKSTSIRQVIIAESNLLGYKSKKASMEEIFAAIEKIHQDVLSREVPEDTKELADTIGKLWIEIHTKIYRALLKEHQLSNFETFLEEYTDEECASFGLSPAQVEAFKLLLLILLEINNTDCFVLSFPKDDSLEEYVMDLLETNCKSCPEQAKYGLSFFLDGIFSEGLKESMATEEGKIKILKTLKGIPEYLMAYILIEAERVSKKKEASREMETEEAPVAVLDLVQLRRKLEKFINLQTPFESIDFEYLEEILGIDGPFESKIGERLLDKICLMKRVANILQNL